MASPPLPLFDKRTVEQSGQGASYAQVQYDPDSFGGAVARSMQGLGQSLERAGQIVTKLDSDKKGNDALNMYNQAKNEARPVLFDPTYGVYAQSGGNAMGTGATVSAAYDNIKKKYLKDADPETAKVFEKLWDRETDSTKDSVARHEMDQLGTYRVETAKTALGQSINDAYNYYNDDKKIEKAVSDATAAIAINVAGQPPEAIAAAQLEIKSQINLAVVSRWAQENPEKALDYYDKHKDDFTGKDHVTANAFVNTARDNRIAQQHIARITSVGGANTSNLFQNLVAAESSGNPNAESAKGASGLAQIMPDTARGLLQQQGRSDLAALDDTQLKLLLKNNQGLNLSLGQTYLNQQLETFNGDVEAALVAYNAGPENAKKFLAHNAGKPPGQRSYDIEGSPLLKKETEPYVQKILGGQIQGFGVSTPPGYRMTRENWNLKNFKPEDLMAPTAGGQWVDARAAQGLDALYSNMQAQFPGLNISVNEKGPVRGTTAGHRRGTADPADNPHVDKSQHLKGAAFDVQVQGWSDQQKATFVTEARKLGFTGFGFYGPNGHLHIDMGNPRTWGTMPDWAKGPMQTPVAQGPIPGAQQPQAPGIGVETDTSQLPDANQYFGIGAQTGGPGAFVGRKSPDLANWIAQAQEIADPGERARTIAGLRAMAAEQQTAHDAQVAVLKQTAWDAVLGGTNPYKLPIEIQSQLPPEFMGQLNTYQTNRAKGDLPMDWKSWSEVPTDVQELAKIDPYTEYRNRLDDEHFDKLITLVREAKKKLGGQEHDDSLLSGQRTAQQIIGDIADMQGWKKGSTSGATAIANFSKEMDRRIAGEAAAKNKPLTAVEIQDIADKLLIVGESERSTFGTAKGFTSSNPNEFVAASSWDEVQDDDKREVNDAYESVWGRTPNQDEATDIYNRAMRVWSGGKPDGPDDEKKDLRQALEAKLKRKLTDREFDVKYSKFLLRFLGR